MKVSTKARRQQAGEFAEFMSRVLVPVDSDPVRAAREEWADEIWHSLGPDKFAFAMSLQQFIRDHIEPGRSA